MDKQISRTVVPLRILGGLAFALVALQVIRPELRQSPAAAEFQAPAEVSHILTESCYPCHSNERRLSWFDEIVPAYWVVAHDVHEARNHLNFSELGGRSPGEQRAAMFQAVNFVAKGLMPLRAYTRLHPSAVVSKAQLDVLEAYLRPKTPPTASAEAIGAADEEYEKWISSIDTPVAVKPSPNGIAFLPDYKNWKAINSTVRFDAYTLRVILGNPVAIQAVADNKTNPWPDGTTFAKVGWFQQPDENGLIRAGTFFKVGFMIKDSATYKSTAGWDWAEWYGVQHKPYGDGPTFATECVTCHKPRESTMFTLFGNDIAIQYSRTHVEGSYPAGAQLTLVTWYQQDDSNWFGANMPGATKSMEVVTVNASPDGSVSYGYGRYQGSPLRAVTSPRGPGGQEDSLHSCLKSGRHAMIGQQGPMSTTVDELKGAGAVWCLKDRNGRLAAGRTLVISESCESDAILRTNFT